MNQNEQSEAEKQLAYLNLPWQSLKFSLSKSLDSVISCIFILVAIFPISPQLLIAQLLMLPIYFLLFFIAHSPAIIIHNTIFNKSILHKNKIIVFLTLLFFSISDFLILYFAFNFNIHNTTTTNLKLSVFCFIFSQTEIIRTITFKQGLLLIKKDTSQPNEWKKHLSKTKYFN